jgi:hypothetical protein
MMKRRLERLMTAFGETQQKIDPDKSGTVGQFFFIFIVSR